MERKLYGTISFEIEMEIDTTSNELNEEIIDRYQIMFENMEPEILLRKLLNDSMIETQLEEVEFTEVE